MRVNKLDTLWRHQNYDDSISHAKVLYLRHRSIVMNSQSHALTFPPPILLYDGRSSYSCVLRERNEEFWYWNILHNELTRQPPHFPCLINNRRSRNCGSGTGYSSQHVLGRYGVRIHAVMTKIFVVLSGTPCDCRNDNEQHTLNKLLNDTLSRELFHIPTLMHNSLFINTMYVTLLSSTCFEH